MERGRGSVRIRQLLFPSAAESKETAAVPSGCSTPASALPNGFCWVYAVGVSPDDIVWLSTQEASKRLGVTSRTLYRFVDEGSLPAYKMGRVFRLKRSDVDEFIDRSRIQPGTLEHLYPAKIVASDSKEEDK